MGSVEWRNFSNLEWLLNVYFKGMLFSMLNIPETVCTTET